ncbi:MAG: transposase [Elusimicrobia bacterium]|nr:transposase [Elusimicrobiota bacterium]
MPRQARMDVPGQVYHVMSRGIERREIFLDDGDYRDFLARISEGSGKTGARCLAWCLMPNHFHFLILRGERTLSELMHRALTGYAVNFNLKYSRVGHLFQNRYKAILCGLENYLLEAAPYIHLNPLRAGLVPDLEGLAGYKWCGHRSIVTGAADGLLDRRALLVHFGGDERAGMAGYKKKMEEKAAEIGRNDLAGGCGRLGCEGGGAALPAFRAGLEVFPVQCVPEKSGFVECVLRSADAAMNRERESRAEVLAKVENTTGIDRRDILRRTRERGPASARALYCHLSKEMAGCSVVELASELGLTQSAVSKLALKGRVLARELQIVQ